MLVIEQQPSPLIPQELKPTEWIIRKSDIVVAEGIRARIIVTFNAGGGANGQEITLNGATFITDNAVPFTSQTWAYSGTAGQSAVLFGNMIRASYAFADWTVSVRFEGLYNVYIERKETGVVSPFVNDMTLVPAVTTSFDPGLDEIRSDDRFWYQFWQGTDPVSEQKYAAFDQSGRVRVDAEPQARKMLGVTDPYLLWTSARYDERMSRNIYLRFGSISQAPNCTTSYNQSYETPEIHVVNALYQHEKVLRFLPYTPNYTLPVKWMTARPSDRLVCRESYEWTSVFLQRSALFPDGFYRVVYTYYNASGGVLNTKTEGVSNQPDGVYHVPTGLANSIHPAGVISLAEYYTVEVQVRGDDLSYIQYSETHTLRLNSCNCWAAEVYYLEDAGSWRTVVFEKIDSRSIEMGAVEWNGPVTYNRYGSTLDGVRLYQDDGIESFADDVQAVFVLMTERITEANRKAYEEFLRSSRHIILTGSDFLNPVTRRITVERGGYGVYQRGESKRLLIPFRFNTYQRVR